MYLMNKENFTIDGWSEQAAKWITHIAVTFEQMKYVNKNPAVNGPKLLLYLITSAGAAPDTRDAGFMDLLRKEQASQDAGGAGVPDEVKAPVAPVVAPVVAPEPPAVPDAPNAALDAVRETLMAMEDKASIIKYSVDTLGQALGLDMRLGKERMVNTIIAELGKPK